MAHAELHRRGFQAYLPLITTRWRDRTWHTTPLFTGYLFVRTRLDRPWNPITYCPGVYSLLSVDGIPSICPEAAVDALQATEAIRAIQAPPSALWAPGMACRPRKGHPLEGVDAVVTDVGATIARVALLLFGQLREVTVPLNGLVARDNA